MAIILVFILVIALIAVRSDNAAKKTAARIQELSLQQSPKQHAELPTEPTQHSTNLQFKCPNCGSLAIQQKAAFDDLIFFGGLAWVFFMPLIYQVLIRPFMQKWFFCRTCSYEFR